MLACPDLNVQGVRLRVEKGGGHDVPEANIRDRWMRSLNQRPWFLALADQAATFDNSGAVPRLIGQKQEGAVLVDPDAPIAPIALREALGLVPRNRPA